MHTDLYNPYEKKFLSQIGVEPVTLTINVSLSLNVENTWCLFCILCYEAPAFVIPYLEADIFIYFLCKYHLFDTQ